MNKSNSSKKIIHKKIMNTKQNLSIIKEEIIIKQIMIIIDLPFEKEPESKWEIIEMRVDRGSSIIKNIWKVYTQVIIIKWWVSIIQIQTLSIIILTIIDRIIMCRIKTYLGLDQTATLINFTDKHSKVIIKILFTTINKRWLPKITFKQIIKWRINVIIPCLSTLILHLFNLLNSNNSSLIALLLTLSCHILHLRVIQIHLCLKSNDHIFLFHYFIIY